MREHMTRGIAAAKVVLVLLTPDYATSDNCLFELRKAVELRKPIIACMAHPGFWRTWAAPDGSRALPDDHEVALAAALAGNMFVDLSGAAALD